MKKKFAISVVAFALTTPALVAPLPPHTAKAKEAVVLAKHALTDIPVSYSYYNIIHEMRNTGVIMGYPDGTFRPNETISRQHAAALVYRAMLFNDITVTKTKKFIQPFDLNLANPYYYEIRALMEADLLEMDKQGKIYPNRPLTRGEMAKILAVVFNLEENTEHVFDDVKGTKYEKYIKALYANGVTTGYGDNTFRMNDSLTRAHYAVFMYRAMKLFKVSEPTNKSPIKYSNWSYHDIRTKIPRPAGYVPGEHEKANAEIVRKIMAENAHGFRSSFTIEANSPIWDESFTFEDKLHLSAEILGITYEEFVDIVNRVIETGEVHDGGTFSVYFHYQEGMVHVTGVRNHTVY